MAVQADQVGVQGDRDGGPQLSAEPQSSLLNLSRKLEKFMKILSGGIYENLPVCKI